MQRFALLIEYDGRPFSGWQRQNDVPSVQGALEAALRALGEAQAVVQGAGRTDAGVHARGQVAHVDLARDWDAFKLQGALNHHVNRAVAVLDAARVESEFHARFSAVERRYLYIIRNRRARLSYQAGLEWQIGYDLDVAAMRQAGQALVGKHDFTTFRSSICQAQSPVKTLDEVGVERLGEEIHFTFRARSFLHNQVRSMVGTLERVGAGKWPGARVAEVLAAADRTRCGPVAPPDGLYLTHVHYGDPAPFA